MANLVYRKSSTPSTNATTAFKGSPLTNDELDNNFFSIDAEVFTKANSNNSLLTGTTSIAQISCALGSINNTTIGFTTASTGKFSTLQATSDLTIGLNLLTTSTTCNIANTTATAVNFAGVGSTVTIGATTGTTTIRNANLAITGNVNVGASKFTVDSANGNTIVAGTLNVSGATTLAGLNAGAGVFTSLSSSGTLGVDGASTLNSLGVTNLATLGSLSVTGSSTFSSNVTLQGSSTAATKSFKINNGASVDKFTVDSANGDTVVAGTLNVTGNTTVTGTLTHGGLVLGGATVDQLVTVTETLTVTTSWVNTSVNFAELATGSYMVQVSTNNNEYYTGIMSWYSADIDSTVTDEIVLHRASAGSETSNLFLKIERTDLLSSPNMTLQISSSVARASASYTYKFRRMI